VKKNMLKKLFAGIAIAAMLFVTSPVMANGPGGLAFGVQNQSAIAETFQGQAQGVVYIDALKYKSLDISRCGFYKESLKLDGVTVFGQVQSSGTFTAMDQHQLGVSVDRPTKTTMSQAAETGAQTSQLQILRAGGVTGIQISGASTWANGSQSMTTGQNMKRPPTPR
jgi:hypothetical protein